MMNLLLWLFLTAVPVSLEKDWEAVLFSWVGQVLSRSRPSAQGVNHGIPVSQLCQHFHQIPSERYPTFLSLTNLSFPVAAGLLEPSFVCLYQTHPQRVQYPSILCRTP